MGAVTTSRAKRVASIFDDLGYSVSGTGPRLRAERKWRVVNISLEPPDTIPSSGEFHCFAAPSDEAMELYRTLSATDPDYEWAVMRVAEDGDVEESNAKEGDVEFLRPASGEAGPIVT